MASSWHGFTPDNLPPMPAHPATPTICPSLMSADPMRLGAQVEALLVELHEEVALLERHVERLLETQRVGVDRVLVRRDELAIDALVETVLRRPRHPYTKALIACIPRLGQKQERLVTIDYSTRGP